jgi:hypothetical protein
MLTVEIKNGVFVLHSSLSRKEAEDAAKGAVTALATNLPQQLFVATRFPAVVCLVHYFGINNSVKFLDFIV